MPPCRAEGAISAPLPRCHFDCWPEVPHLHESCKSVFALQHAGFPVSAAAPLPIAVQTFDALLWYPAAVQHIHVWHPTFVLTIRCAFLRQPPKRFAPSTVGTDTLLAPLCAADAFCAAEGRSVLFGFTDRVAPVLVLLPPALVFSPQEQHF